MTISKKTEGSKLTIALEGRLDTMTARSLETEFKDSLPGVTELTLDLAELAYISSAGLRVILIAIKLMKKQGSMVVRNVNDVVMSVFDDTGFSDLMTIE